MTDTFLERFEKRRQERVDADRTFVLAGEKLTHRAAVAPEVGMRLEDMRSQMLVGIVALREALAQANGNAGAVEQTLPYTDQQMLDVGDETALACLEPDSREAWARLRAADAPHPLTFEEVFEVVDYLLERVTGIPTAAPAESSAGRTKTAKPSKAASSSRAKTRAASP